MLFCFRQFVDSRIESLPKLRRFTDERASGNTRDIGLYDWWLKHHRETSAEYSNSALKRWDNALAPTLRCQVARVATLVMTAPRKQYTSLTIPRKCWMYLDHGLSTESQIKSTRQLLWLEEAGCKSNTRVITGGCLCERSPTQNCISRDR